MRPARVFHSSRNTWDGARHSTSGVGLFSAWNVSNPPLLSEEAMKKHAFDTRVRFRSPELAPIIDCWCNEEAC